MRKELIQILKDAERIAILGVGSELRGDDIAGILAAQKLNNFFSESGSPLGRPADSPPKFKIFIGGTAPENFTGEIKKFNPTHLLIIDSADMGGRPGTVKLIPPDKITGFSFSTHSLPLKMMAEYLAQSLVCRIIIIGIQPKTLEFGKSPSREVVKSVKDIADILKGFF